MTGPVASDLRQECFNTRIAQQLDDAMIILHFYNLTITENPDSHRGRSFTRIG